MIDELIYIMPPRRAPPSARIEVGAMPNSSEYIELNRQFVELNTKDVETTDIEARLEWGLTSAHDWSTLLAEHRVVILSSAGTGKSWEISSQCRKLRDAGESAFFLRLEDLAIEWELAFEIGDADELAEAVRSEDELWLFLDSIDEARLDDPKALDRAFKRLRPKIRDNLQNVHIVLTSRIGAWRPWDDAARVDELFPYTTPRKLEHGDDDEDRGSEKWADDVLTPKQDSGESAQPASIKYFTLLHLSAEQMRRFAAARGLESGSELVSEIVRQDMRGLAGRPKDLDDLISFWEKYGQLGTRREVVEENIRRKLVEDDLDRAERDPLTPDKASAGVRKLSATVSLTHHAKINVPGKSPSDGAISVQAALAHWSPKECSSLLGRPIFEPETYGFVRFDHRDSREYLAARWFFELIEGGQSRARVEQLFFKNQYGIDLVVPSLRPILPWLAILDPIIRKRIMTSWPEVLLEGGDPSELPPTERTELLERFCARYATSGSRFSFDMNALQRLVGQEQSLTIRRLYQTHRNNRELATFLLRAIELSLLKDLADIAIAATQDTTHGLYTRLAAMRAVVSVCDESQIASTCQAILSGKPLTERKEAAFVLEIFGAKYISAPALMELIKNVEPKERYSSDQLNRAVIDYIGSFEIEDVVYIVTESARLLKQEPFIERRFFEASQKNFWMVEFAIVACERLVRERHSAALSVPCLRLISLISICRDYDIGDIKTNLAELIPLWPELNAALFWFDVKDARRLLDKKKGERLTDWWRVRIFCDLWRFDTRDIDLVIRWIGEKQVLDDRLIALTLAFALYREMERPASLRKRLWKAVDGSSELSARLSELMNPPAMSEAEKRYKRSESHWKRRTKERERKDTEYHEKWRLEIQRCLANIREKVVPPEGRVWNSQRYLFDRMRALGKDNNRWAQANWRALEAEVGRKAAEAMRDGLMAIWRRYDPTLSSEVGECSNSTPVIETMALSGLEIEARYVEDWAATLADWEAKRAARYLLSELNGFPSWFRVFEAQHADKTLDVVLRETIWDLFENPGGDQGHYVIAKISSHAPWFGDRVAPHLVPLLMEREPRDANTLSRVLSLIAACDAVDDVVMARLCELRIHDTGAASDQKPLWYAAWVSVDPLPAIDSLTQKLALIDAEAALNLAVGFINALYGTRYHSEIGLRNAHKTPGHLRALYFLMHQYIRPEDDIDRSGGGVYSPTSRDHAQDARGRIYENLVDIPGKEAFDALVAIAENQTSEIAKSWLLSRAVARAQADADAAWTVEDINEFEIDLERTPKTPLELFEVARNRLNDLKTSYEDGDTSPWKVLISIKLEEVLRNYLADELIKSAHARYSISQEDEMPNDQRTDIRFVRAGIPGMVPVEVKIADKWSGTALFEKLKDQLCGDYLRDADSMNGIYLLVNEQEGRHWDCPITKKRLSFSSLVVALQEYAQKLIADETGISNIQVIGIDLTKRKQSMQ
ncbi:hypothetical protein [Phaeobacter inhibens]|uniref:hypothetical protein n=1 Tax=Phaeobacter inhibens TaxID=221822 RepID=UPI000F472CD2|nr:hypothetical protein [Phaeobacter inhibens]